MKIYKIKNLITVIIIGVAVMFGSFGIGTSVEIKTQQSLLSFDFNKIFGMNKAKAAINSEINYQGKLVHPTTNIEVPDGNYNIKFTIYDAVSCLWTARGTCVTPTARSVAVSSGLFSVMMGDTVAGDNAIDLDFNTNSYYLGITVEGDSEMDPRKKLGAVPQAFNADKLGGHTWTAPNAIGSGTPNTGAFTTLNGSGNIVFDGGSFIFNEAGADLDFRLEGDAEQNLFFLDANVDRIGIGTAAPNNRLEILSITSPQLRVAYDTSNYLTVGADSTGRITFDATGSGSDTGFLFQDAIFQPVYGSDDGLVLDIDFSEGMGTKAYDKSKFGNDGTLTNFNSAATGDGNVGGTTLVDSGLTDTAAIYIGAELYITSGNNIGQHQTVSAYDGTTTLTVDTAFTHQILNTTTYIVGWAPGKYGNGLMFDGGNDYVTVADSESLRNYTAKSVFMWGKFPAATGVGRYIIDDGYWNSPYGDLLALHASVNNIQIYLRNNSGTIEDTSFSFTPNEWVHFGYAWDGTTVKYYKDGAEIDTDEQTGTLECSAHNLFIGMHHSISNHLNGSIDGVKIYSRALHADEVKAHYLRGTETHADVAISDSTTVGNLYGNRIILTDTGAVAAATDYSYGEHITVTRTGTDAAGTVVSYGVHSTVIGDGGGDSTAIGGYFSAASADKNYGLLVPAGYVGIGLAAPTTTLHVAGQCVTADTRLRRRRKKKKGPIRADGSDEPTSNGASEKADPKKGEWEDSEYIYDEVMIKDIRPGDEIASMDPITGELVYSQVNGLMNMGIKPLYRLTTQSGRQIRTTENHPYFVRGRYDDDGVLKNTEPKHQKLYKFEVDQSIKIEQYSQDTIVAIANKENSITLRVPRKVKQTLRTLGQKYDVSRLERMVVFASAIVTAMKQMNAEIRELAIDTEYIGYDDVISKIIGNVFPDIYINFEQVGKKSPAHLACYGVHKKQKIADYTATIGDLGHITENALGAGAHPHIRRTIHRTWTSLVTNSINHNKKLVKPLSVDNSRLTKDGQWTKVKGLKVGQMIAVTHGDKVVWEKIVEIKQLPAERVYDIEVQGTHNFVANGIIAHNTYIDVNDAAGLVVEQSGTKPNVLVVDTVSGNVGIGVANPDTALEIYYGGNQLKLSFNDDDTAIFAVDDNGDLTITASGSEIKFGAENLSTTGTLDAGAATVTSLDVTSGGITNAGAISGVGNVTFSASPTLKLGSADGSFSFTDSGDNTLMTLTDSGTTGDLSITGAMFQPVYGSDDGLVLNIDFSEGMGTKAYDKSKFGNDGTLTNFNSAATGGSTTTLIDAALTNGVDLYEGAELYITSGANIGQHQTVLTYDEDDTLTVDTAFTDAIVNGVTYIVGWAPGKYGNGLMFDGGNDYVTVADSESLKVTNMVTFEAWVYATKPTTWQYIANKGTYYTIGKSWHILLTDVNSLRFGIEQNLAVFDYTDYFDEWHYITVTFDKDLASNQMKLYVDGQLKSNGTRTSAMPSTSDDVIIGRADTAQNYFTGSIDEVKIYSRALDAEEIKAHYLRGTETHADVAISDSTTVGNLYGNRIILTDTGAVASGDDYSYGEKIIVSRTDAGAGSTADLYTYGIHSTVTGDTDGTDSLAVGGYFTATGADDNFGIQVDGKCVTGDTLLPIVKSEEFSIFEVRAQDFVPLRNQQNQKALNEQDSLTPLEKENIKTAPLDVNSLTGLTRRPVELNHIPEGTDRVSDDSQNRPASASSRPRNNILTNKENKNNLFVSEEVVSVPFFRDVVSPDTRYHYYNKPEKNVNPVSVDNFSGSLTSGVSEVKLLEEELLEEENADAIEGSLPQSTVEGCLPNIQYIQIKDVKPGMKVLSLNEKTNKIEPRRINGLLDMGVKPIYEIVTEDGRKIRTTGNHPYLKKSKIENQKSRGEILSPSGNSFHSSTFNTINLPENFENSDNNLAKEEINALQSDCGIFNQITEKISDFPYQIKSSSLVTNTCFSFNESAANQLSLADLGDCLTSKFSDFKNLNNSARAFSSSRNFGLSDAEEFPAWRLSVDDDIIFFGQRSSIIQSSGDVPAIQRRKRLQDFSSAFAGSEHFQNLPDHNSGFFETGLAVTDAWISSDVIVDDNFVHKFYNDSFNNYNKNENDLSNSNSEWIKVAYLNIGDEIAVADILHLTSPSQREESTSPNLSFARRGTVLPLDKGELEGVKFGSAKFVKIKEINLLPAEQVYDIEVEGTHNFVAGHFIDNADAVEIRYQQEQDLLISDFNSDSVEVKLLQDLQFGGIIAHNTYINVNDAAGLVVENSGTKPNVLVVDTASGNVGIGVADPDKALEVYYGGDQLKLSFNDDDTAIFAVDDNGDLTITASGDEIKFGVENISTTGTLGAGATTVTGAATLGDGGTANYAQFSATGDLTFFDNDDGALITGPGAKGMTLTNAAGALTISTTTSGALSLTSAGALTASYSGGQIIGTGTNAITLGNSGDTLALASSGWAISTTGDMTGIGSIDQGLIAWWPLDEGTGDDIIDKSGQSNDGAFISCPSAVTDADGNVYNTIVVGSQCWMKENLNVGAIIASSATMPTDNSVIEKWCNGLNTDGHTTTGNCVQYGGLYSWDEAMGYPSGGDTGEICPTGWHIPTDTEYKTLEVYLGMCEGVGGSPYCVDAENQWRGTNEGSELASNAELWKDTSAIESHANFGNSGFDALPAGYRRTDNTFYDRTRRTHFWSSSEGVTGAWRRGLYYTRTDVTRYDHNKAYGFSVRCLKD